MTGALLQLISKGAQDVYYIWDMKNSYFRSNFKRHSNFAIETKELYVKNKFKYGTTLEIDIPRKGDLISGVYIKVRTPRLNFIPVQNRSTYAGYTNSFMHSLIQKVELYIGDCLIDTHISEFMEAFSEVYIPQSKKNGYNKMIGKHIILVNVTKNAREELTYWLPLHFTFCRDFTKALPLIALQYHKVTLKIYTRPYDRCIVYDGTVLPTQENELHGQIYADYIYLDNDEREWFAKRPHEYVIEQLQFTEELIRANTKGDVFSLQNFNHPVKQLIFMARENELEQVNDHFNFSHYRRLHGTIDLSDNGAAGPTTVTVFEDHRLLTGDFISIQGISDDQNFILNRTFQVDVNLFDSSINAKRQFKIPTPHADIGNSAVPVLVVINMALSPFNEVKLVLNTHDLFEKQHETYFRLLQNYKYNVSTPNKFINTYNFGIRPYETNHTGSLNFSRIDNAELKMSFAPDLKQSTLIIMAFGYNVLRIISGMAGLAFSS